MRKGASQPLLFLLTERNRISRLILLSKFKFMYYEFSFSLNVRAPIAYQSEKDELSINGYLTPKLYRMVRVSSNRLSPYRWPP